MGKCLYDRLIEDVLDKMPQYDVSKKNMDDILSDYNLVYKDHKFYRKLDGDK